MNKYGSDGNLNFDYNSPTAKFFSLDIILTIIQGLKEAFPEKNIEIIIKALDKANNDFEDAFQIFFQNPESLENTKKSRHKTKKNIKEEKTKIAF